MLFSGRGVYDSSVTSFCAKCRAGDRLLGCISKRKSDSLAKLTHSGIENVHFDGSIIYCLCGAALYCIGILVRLFTRGYFAVCWFHSSIRFWPIRIPDSLWRFGAGAGNSISVTPFQTGVLTFFVTDLRDDSWLSRFLPNSRLFYL